MSRADIDEGRKEGVTSDERAELIRLRRELRAKEMEIEILKRASVNSTDQCNTLDDLLGGVWHGEDWKTGTALRPAAASVGHVESRELDQRDPAHGGVTTGVNLFDTAAPWWLLPAATATTRGTLSLVEREEISRGLAGSESCRAIARRLGRSPSTITREIARNKGARRYRAVDADDRAWRRARRPKRCKLAKNPVLRGYAAARLREDWPPEQIAGVLKKTHPAGSRMRVSHETIYKSVFIQPRGVLAKELPLGHGPHREATF